MSKKYILNGWQKKALKAFADKYGVDAMVNVVIEFEKTGKLGQAMLKNRG